jgi:hypothetical protein
MQQTMQMGRFNHQTCGFDHISPMNNGFGLHAFGVVISGIYVAKYLTHGEFGLTISKWIRLDIVYRFIGVQSRYQSYNLINNINQQYGVV